jgi:hypothetical protein
MPLLLWTKTVGNRLVSHGGTEVNETRRERDAIVRASCAGVRVWRGFRYDEREKALELLF